jgi:hypothetical protein
MLGCGDGSGPGAGPVVDCDEVVPTGLAAGQLALMDASETACVRLAPVSADASYLYVAYSAADEETRDGTSAEYRLTGAGGVPPAAAAVTPPGLSAARAPTRVQRFHDRLRARGQELAWDHPGQGVRARVAPGAVASTPVLGEQRSFNVLRSADVIGTAPGDFGQFFLHRVKLPFIE